MVALVRRRGKSDAGVRVGVKEFLPGNSSFRSISSERWWMRVGGTGLLMSFGSGVVRVRGSVEAEEARLECCWPIAVGWYREEMYVLGR